MKKTNWDEWFAGLVDGDGCFYINKKKEVSFELTTHVTDSRIVYNLKNILKGGSVRLRSGSKSIRYRVKKKDIVRDIILRLNGQLKNPQRLNQLKKACELLAIDYKPSFLTIEPDSSYLSGLIDSDGTITISISHSSKKDSQQIGKLAKQIRLQNSRGFNQLSLKVTSIYESPLTLLYNSYQVGRIYKETANKSNKSPKDKYHWTFSSEDDFRFLYSYLRKHPLKSIKKHRIRLSLIYFHYKKLKYHLKDSGTVEHKLWIKFCKSWFKYAI